MRVRVTRVREEMRAGAGEQGMWNPTKKTEISGAAQRGGGGPASRGGRMHKRSKFRRRDACASRKTEFSGGGANATPEGLHAGAKMEHASLKGSGMRSCGGGALNHGFFLA